ncbi:MAG: polysaccharide biosynthesis protein [Ruminiclostridium sp.]|nr:polysaccharide biosynthesis protein [Ruminiclostridium sp.]
MNFSNKNILVIGGTGTIGQTLVKKLLALNPRVIRIYSRDEYKQFVMQSNYCEEKRLRFLLGDVRDKERLDRAMNGVDVVFDLAALKHVPAAEYNPFEAVKTNVIGTQNVIECAMDNNIEKVIYTSSDKAVSPTNTMGATKLLAERMIVSANYYRGNADIVFAAVRFGNVMGSRGSVLPLWREQILANGYITITEPEMTRFMMSINDAAGLTIKACEKARGGEVFVLKMPVMKLIDLAEVFTEEICKKHSLQRKSIEIRKTGLRPGEKMYEELMSNKEKSESLENEDMYEIIPSGGFEKNMNRGMPVTEETAATEEINEAIYSSEYQNIMTKAEIRRYLHSNDLII